MPKIPEHDYTVSELDEKKLYAVSYKYQVKGEWFADTWNITERICIGNALKAVDEFCSGNVDSRNWDAYEITNINKLQ